MRDDNASVQVHLEPAQLDDWARLWVWRNQETTRANSRSAAPISLETHWEWLKTVLKNDAVRLYVAGDSSRQVRIGTCRLDRTDSTVECSLTIDERERGKGYAVAILTALLREAKQWHGVTTATAIVRRDNLASVRAFAALRFHPDSNEGNKSEFVELVRQL